MNIFSSKIKILALTAFQASPINQSGAALLKRQSVFCTLAFLEQHFCNEINRVSGDDFIIRDFHIKKSPKLYERLDKACDDRSAG